MLIDEVVQGFEYVNYSYLEGVVEHTSFSSSEVQGYLDVGDATTVCPYCSTFWFHERSEKYKSSSSLEFSLCCMRGKITLPFMKTPPKLLMDLFNGVDNRSYHFLKNLRAYNSIFSFTSIGAKIESERNDGKGPPQFVISGQNYHLIGSLLPVAGEQPKFAQLYIHDTQHEVEYRINCLSDGRKNLDLDATIVSDLVKMVDDYNVLAKSFRVVRDEICRQQTEDLVLLLYRKWSSDPRTYNLPSIDEVAAVIVGDFDTSDCGRDVIVRCKDGLLQRIHETHIAFLPLQYPLLFPYGEDGYQENIPFHANSRRGNCAKRKRISLREFISFRIQDRNSEQALILRSRRLFQQFIVDAYSMIECQTLSFIRNNQSNIRKEFLSGVEEAVNRGNVEPASIGSRVVLPSSFVGGHRYMFNNCQDAMAICRHFGYPDLFLTVTCNPKWPEIQRYVESKGLNAHDRPDILSRLFHIKLDQMMADFKKGDFLGKQLQAGMYTIEFQKRGLPHAHILLWLNNEDKIDSNEKIDSVVCAEFPDPKKYPKLFHAVSTYMVHGPCGNANKTSPCMRNGKCSKFFPKKFSKETSFDGDGFAIYRRRDLGFCIVRKEIELDNRFIVPYNPLLLMKYQAHINIEFCNKSSSIKYPFKYINRGVDRVTMSISNRSKPATKYEETDEIKQYYDCRYLSPCESAWRIFSFDIHSRWPSVQRLSFHLPKQQLVVFRDIVRIDDVFARTNEKKTMFLAWMDANAKYVEARDLTFAQFPEFFVYHANLQEWQLRKSGFSIGRLSYFPPTSGELFYLRLLLNVQKGCSSFIELRTVNGIIFDTFQEACNALGLLGDDREFVDCIKEASSLASGHSLRRLFVSLLLSNSISKPMEVWDATWELLSEGILYDKRINLHDLDYTLDDETLKNLCLLEIEKLLIENGKSLREFETLPCPNFDQFNQFHNILLLNELSYDTHEMAYLFQQNFDRLNVDQLNVFNQVNQACVDQVGGFFFVYGYGGTGKTFLWETLSYKLRSQKKVVLNVASSGIASLLLPGGKTAHSQFSIPLALNEDSCYNISQGSLKAGLLQHTSLIIWDEAPMVNRWAFEALDRTLRDIMRFHVHNSCDKPFGGKVVVLGGDFRQILPVVHNGNRADIVMATINSSRLWKFCKVLHLTQNIRLAFNPNNVHDQEQAYFAQWILSLGDGLLGSYNDGEATVDIPNELLIHPTNHAIHDIVHSIYPNVVDEFKHFDYFKDKAILAPTLDVVNSVNEYVLSLLPGEDNVYLSCDSILKGDEDIGIQSDWVTTEFLNNIRCSGIPDHKLILKKGVPIMLMRNLDMSAGLCNGTRLIVEEMGQNIIGATVVTGTHVGSKVYIPRLSLVLSDRMTPFKFQR